MPRNLLLALFFVLWSFPSVNVFGRSPEEPRQSRPHSAIQVLRDAGAEFTCTDATPFEHKLFSKPFTDRLHLLDGFRPNQSAGLKIILRGTDQLERFPEAKEAFIQAAAQWESKIASRVTVIINVDYGPTRFGQPYPERVLGSTDSQSLFNYFDYALLRGKLIEGASTPEERALYLKLPDTFPIEGNPLFKRLYGASALSRALGLLRPEANPAIEIDLGPLPSIGFNSNFTFDFDPSDGIDADKIDFDAVAVHEIGHVLGFSSAVGSGEWGTPIPTVLDMFRFRPGVTTDSFSERPRTLASGGDHVFFGGASQIPLSTGRQDGTGGDGNQASHWKDDAQSGHFIGIMDPTLARGVRETITQADLHAFDLMGYALAGQSEYDRTPPVVTYTSPDGSGTFRVGDAIPIKWSVSDNVKVTGQRIDLSLDGGISFPVTIAAGIPATAGEFLWTAVPGTDSDQARVRVTAFDEMHNVGAAVGSRNLTILPSKGEAQTPPPRELTASPDEARIRLDWKTPSPGVTALVKPAGVKSIKTFIDSRADGSFLTNHPIAFGEQLIPSAYPATLKSVLYLSLNSLVKPAGKPLPSAAGAEMRLHVFQAPSFGSTAAAKSMRTYLVMLQREPRDSGSVREPSETDPGDLNEFVLPEDFTITEGAFCVALEFVGPGSSGLNGDGSNFAYVFDGNAPSTAVLSEAQAKFRGVGLDYPLPDGGVARPDFAFMGRIEQRGLAQVTGYSVHRSTASPVAVVQANKIGSVGPTTTTFTDETAAPNTKYNYVVTAQYASGESLASNEITATGTGNDTQPPTVKVTAPNGGETFMSGGRIDIKWSATDNVGVVTQTVELSTDGGLSFSVPAATGLNGSFSAFAYDIPSTLKSDRARVRVTSTDAAGNKASDVSDNDFRIVGVDVAPPTVKVLAPNGGEKFKAGATAKITWQSSDDTAIVSQDVLLSTDGGKTFAVKLASGLPGTAQSLDFVVPATKTKTARVRIVARDAAGNSAQDDGDGDFTIKVKK